MNTLQEALWMAGALFIAALAPASVSLGFLRSCLAACRRMGRSASTVILGLFIVGTFASALLCARGHLPQPVIHDDFSNLLAADTFASGRLTNVPHVLWQHFEAMHIIQQPTYMSKYPPGNPLLLALGQVLFGEPIVGAWLSMGLAAAAIAWMLRAWLPPYWALLGAVIGACRYCPNWGEMYTGGALAACGGALTLGATQRLVTNARPRYALLAALGSVIMANTRPYEGLVTAVVCGVYFLWSRPGLQPTLTRVVAPALVVLLPAAAWMGYYNYRVTGDAFVTPYQLHDATYAATPLFYWQADVEPLPEYRHQIIRDFWIGWERPRYLWRREYLGFNATLVTKLYKFARFYIGPILLIPILIMLRWGLRTGMAFPGAAVLAVLLALSQANNLHVHYVAPVAGAMTLLAVQGLRLLRLWKPFGRPAGAMIAASIVAVSILYLLVPLTRAVAGPGRAPTARTRIVERLEKEGGKHLVLVRYPPGHSSHEDWGYNRADIDNSDIVWATEMDLNSNRRLADYFADRRFWRLLLPQEEVVEIERESLLSTSAR